MAGTILFLIHGVGQRPSPGTPNPGASIAKTWWREPVDALLSAAQTFAPDVSIGLDADTHGVKIVPLSYCDLIVNQLAAWEDAGSSDVAGAVAKTFPDLGAEYLQDLQDISAEDAGFFWSKSVDVILYRVFHDQAIRQHVRAQIVAALRDNSEDGRLPAVAFISHSMGTAVLHDTLFELLNDPAEFGGLVNLNVISYASLANVSKVLANLVNPHTSLVRPFGAPGTGLARVRSFVDARHDLDPVALIGGFRPGWDPTSSRYRPVTMRRIHDLNTHSYVEYLRHPGVWGPILEKVLMRPLAPSALQAHIAAHDAKPEPPCVQASKQFVDAVEDFRVHMEALRPQGAWQAIAAFTKAVRMLEEARSACH